MLKRDGVVHEEPWQIVHMRTTVKELEPEILRLKSKTREQIIGDHERLISEMLTKVQLYKEKVLEWENRQKQGQA